MFGGPPPQMSAAELKAQEQEAALTVQKVIVGAVLLYLSPFAIDAVKKLV
ncbi:mitochondrial outer membrane translocase complex, subunit Tom5 [Tricladium varicosporioides]|nr:mitochondrial outer membrane translocase complex, subunit Tom5 [Halenospora varia]KAH8646382.1 mitochondrial outer membrane translocase complex, subunit Tom5 [Hymenoscyphus varicosporioides]